MGFIRSIWGPVTEDKMDALTDTHTTPLAEICTAHLKTNKEEHHHISVFTKAKHRLPNPATMYPML